MKIVSVACYFDPNYIRTQVLETALRNLPDVELIAIHTTQRGLLRYPEIVWKLLKFRLSTRAPDAYLLNFRGYELLPFVLLLAGRTPVIFDEFINPVEVLAEHRQQKDNAGIKALMGVFNLFARFYYWLLGRCRVVLCDTEAHKQFTARESGRPLGTYAAIPVGTDETVFRPAAPAGTDRPAFQVFYYGSMVPLHGVEYVIDAAIALKDIPDISFVIAGKTGRYKTAIETAATAGAHITCLEWIDFADLPQYIHGSRVCIGGPLGGTPQAQYVVTGKTYQFLACGTVTLVGKNEATAAQFVDKQNALVVPQADATALAASLRWAYEHQDELPQIARAGRTLYEQQFSSAVIEQQLRALLGKL